jgi:hypothetical protein
MGAANISVRTVSIATDMLTVVSTTISPRDFSAILRSASDDAPSEAPPLRDISAVQPAETTADEVAAAASETAPRMFSAASAAVLLVAALTSDTQAVAEPAAETSPIAAALRTTLAARSPVAVALRAETADTRTAAVRLPVATGLIETDATAILDADRGATALAELLKDAAHLVDEIIEAATLAAHVVAVLNRSDVVRTETARLSIDTPTSSTSLYASNSASITRGVQHTLASNCLRIVICPLTVHMVLYRGSRTVVAAN